jgi:hypothetical protein
MHRGRRHGQLRGWQKLRRTWSKKTIFENHAGIYPEVKFVNESVK